MTIVQNTELTADGNPAKGVKVTARIGGVPAASSAQDASVIASASTVSDASGHWQLSLIPNTGIIPAGTWYVIRRTYPTALGGAKVEQFITVPPSGAPQNFEDLVTSEPDAPRLTASELTDHLAHSDPHPQYLTQTDGDGRYLTQTAGDARYAPFGSTGGDGTVEAADVTGLDSAITSKRLDQFATPTSDIGLGGKKITGLGTGSASGDAATKGQLDSAVSAINSSVVIGAGIRLYVQSAAPAGDEVQNGHVWFDHNDPPGVHVRVNGVWTGTGTPATPTPTPTGSFTPATETQLSNAWSGYKTRHIKNFGGVYGAVSEGSDNGNRVVSESQAYGLKLAVARNDKATFDAIENLTKTRFERRNAPIGAPGKFDERGPHLMAWISRIDQNAVVDWNWATDGDIDRAVAKIWAAYRWGGTDTTFQTQQLDEAKVIINELKATSFVITNSKAYLVTDQYQNRANGVMGHHDLNGGFVSEMNPSYIDLAAFRLFKKITGDAFWDQAIEGGYDLLIKCSDNAGAIPTAFGLFPDWCSFVSTRNDVGRIRQGVDGWQYTRGESKGADGDIAFSYDAFRTVHRLYWDFVYYGDVRSRNLLNGALKTFYASEWASRTKILSEYDHDGTTIVNDFEQTMMTFGAWMALSVNDLSNATAISVWNSRLDPAVTYKSDAQGAFFASFPSGTPGYYSDSWLLMDYSLQAGKLVNYGQ